MKATVKQITSCRSVITAHCVLDVGGQDDIAIVQVPWAKLSEAQQAVLSEAVQAELDACQPKEPT